MAEIFVSYRRGDSAGHTGRLVDHLQRHFGKSSVFQDVQSIEAGSRWDEVIAQGIRACRALVVVIGPAWLAAAPDGKRRIDDPQDHLRREVATGLERGIAVIPVLVHGAHMPRADELPDDLKPLPGRQWQELSDSRWDYDTQRLMGVLETAAGIHPSSVQKVDGGPSRRKKAVVMGILGAAVMAGGVWVWLGEHRREAPVPSAGTPPITETPATGGGSSKLATVAPARFEGLWYDESATSWGIRKKNDQVEINHTAPGSGTAIGYAEGKISDRTINFEYVQMVPDAPRLRGELVLSEDGKRLTGVLSDLKNGGNTHLVLRRREP